MQLHEDRDVILLNSDTEVYGDWAARLRRVAYSTKEIGTVTPLSNNATICSYPKFPDEFDGPFEVGFEGLDELARQANANASVDVPTGVGFCMFIRRVCIDQVGYFDVDTFKTGYGEENDFCLRIAARGWRSVLAGNVFVRHLGRISFREMAQERLKDALHEIDARYPTYRQNIEAFIATDPPRSLRHSLDIARLKRAAGARVFVFVLHGEGGGTLKHAEDLADDLRQTGVGVLFLRPVISNGSIAELSHPDVHDLSGAHLIDLRHGLPHGIRVFRELGVEHIHIHHLLGYSPEIIDFIPKLAEACGIRYDFTFHDYLAACPRIDMIDGSGFYCDNFDVNRCETCISKFGSLFGDVAVWEWRERYGRMLRGARRLFVPNLDAQHRLKALFPGLDTIVRAHHESAVTYIGMPQSQQKAQQSKAKAELDVAIVGGLSLRKGARVLLEMANDASQRRLPIKFVLFGYSDLPEFKTMPNVKVLGKYSEGELPKLLHASGCRVVFFPAIWPETYSYTLSEAYRANCFPVAFDIGAIADRIRASGWGRVLPFRLAREPRGVNDLLLALKIDRKPDHFFIPVGSYDPERMLEEYYGFMAPRRHLSCGSRDQFDHL
jgi:glycosyltransferase involved in cell wall biosynthesis